VLFFLPKPVRRLVYLAVLLGLLAIADIGVRIWAENQVEAGLDRQLAGVASVDVGFSGFPFVGRALLLGEVDQISVTLEEVQRTELTFATVGIRLSGIVIDRGALTEDRRVRFEDVDRGTAFAEISQTELRRITGLEVTLEPGVAEIIVAGQTVRAAVTVREGVLVVQPPDAPAISVPVPTFDFLPCVANATVLTGRIRVGCSLDTIPAPLVQLGSDVANHVGFPRL
jgi:hypothetical protein